MAKSKKERKTGLSITVGCPMYIDRCIVVDSNGVPWVIDPKKGSIAPATIKMSAVSK